MLELLICRRRVGLGLEEGGDPLPCRGVACMKEVALVEEFHLGTRNALGQGFGVFRLSVAVVPPTAH